MRERRAWLASIGQKQKRWGKNKKAPSQFEAARFVAVDGEGFTDGDTIRVEIARPGGRVAVHEGRDHFYGLLMDSDGHELWEGRAGHRLGSKACIDFLLAIGERSTKKEPLIPVVFSGGYDVCHMLAFGMSRDETGELLLKSVSGRNTLDFTLSDTDGVSAGENLGQNRHDYRIEYRPRKSVKIWRFAHGSDKYVEYIVNRDKPGERVEWRLNAEASVTLWDVWGFFQGSFVGALDTWLPSHPDHAFIKKMKGQRSDFDRSEISDIRRYTQMELRLLVELMNRVRESVKALDLTVTRWDGAGSIAGAMFRKYDVKSHMAETPRMVFEAARRAYSGGHIEACKVGYHPGKVYHNDINSAYPHQFRKLPSLAGGRWFHDATGQMPASDFALVRLEYHFRPGQPFYPLFNRTERGTILYPERGSGWYWANEARVAEAYAQRIGAITFRVCETFTFHPGRNEPPFGWIEDAYARRQQLVAETKRTGVPNGEEKTIKLGINSCYGKTAQQVGARVVGGEFAPPPYFQVEWAGFVTAGCRAQLMGAALENPEAIISFATDALFSTAPLAVDAPREKILGAWESVTHEGMSLVMPGVYWLHDTDKVRHYSRGFNKAELSDPERIHDAWRRKQTSIMIPQTRMVTLGAANVSDNFWKLRGVFVTSERELVLNGRNAKRYPIALTQCNPHREMVPTHPIDHMEAYDVELAALMSEPYPIAWLDGPEADPDTDPADDAFFNSREAFDAFGHA